MVFGLLLTTRGHVEFREVRDELDEWYSLLGCEMIECPTVMVPWHKDKFTIICDEEARFNGNDTPTVFRCPDEPIILGSIFVCKTDDEGRLVDLSPSDAIVLSRRLSTVFSKGRARLVLDGLELA